MTDCKWCGLTHGPRCHAVVAIEYYPDGAVKRVEFVKPEPFLTASELAFRTQRGVSIDTAEYRGPSMSDLYGKSILAGNISCSEIKPDEITSDKLAAGPSINRSFGKSVLP